MSGWRPWRWLAALTLLGLVCVSTASPARAGGFLCHETNPSPGSPGLPKGLPASAADAFQSAVYELKEREALCAPATVGAAAPADASTHLAAYRVVPAGPRHVRRTDLLVASPLGQARLDTIKPDRLLVPAATSLSGPVAAPDPASHLVDHYACYKVRATAGTPKFAPIRGVAVADVLGGGPRVLDLTKITRLCLAADKNGEGIKQPAARLLCYQARPAPGQPRPLPVPGLHVGDQLGAARLDTGKKEELCLPAPDAIPPVNLPPDVDAGPDATITLPATAALTGSVTDDGLPGPPDALASTWTMVSGPGTVAFDDPSSPVTSASFSASGTYVLRLTATDGEANASDDVAITVNEETSGPPDPADVAPPLVPNAVTRFADATAFLHEGPDPIQTGLAPGAIEPGRAAVLRGRVLDRAGAPLRGVAVNVLHHPQLGQTLSRADGWFDLAVNGGGLLTVHYQRAGFLPAQRQVRGPWQDYAVLADVVLVPLDPVVTTIDLGAAVPMQVARGSVMTDGDGSRQATLLFPQGTQASLVMPDGSTQPLSTLAVRATEFTVGTSGPRAMPGELPPASAYTYAVELSADEAFEAGATEVRFSQPVPFYVENFLGFPVGTRVPLGYYDRAVGRWTAAPDGQVVRILAVAGGLADLDTTGDGGADNGVALGVTDAERARLASLYAPGQTLWRSPIPHFTPWDCNWPYVPPPDALPPSPPPPGPDDEDEPEPDCREGSIIECQNQVLRESIPVAGTPYRLAYASDRAAGWRVANELTIPLSGTSIPASLRRIDLEIRLAGRLFTHSFPPAPDLAHVFAWDGLDAYGRELPGRHTAVVRIGYVYGAEYAQPDVFRSSFGRFSGTAISGSRARSEITSWLELTRSIGSLRWLDPAVAFGTWSLSVHHAYDPIGGILHLGDGTRRGAAASRADVIGTAAGNGAAVTGGPTGDGGPATAAQVPNPRGTAVGPDGSVYIASPLAHRVRRVDVGGTITTFAGTGVSGTTGADDDRPATQSRVSSPNDVAVGPDGSVYIAEVGRVRRVGLDGIITTVAGTGSVGFAGDGGPATAATLGTVFSIDVAADGSLYILESAGRVRRVGPDGIITTVAGTGTAGFGGDGGPAIAAQLRLPSGIAAAADGSLYIADTMNNRIRRVGPDGIISTVAGNGDFGYTGDGGGARLARMNRPRDVVLAPDGNLYIADSCNHVIRRVTPSGIITTVAGDGTRHPSFDCVNDFAGDGAPATRAKLSQPWSLAFGPDGTLVVGDFLNHRVRAIASVLPRLDLGDVVVASERGTHVFRFSPFGRHLDTRNALTGSVLLQFGYDAEGRLSTVTDGDGNATAIERDGQGRLAAIVGPFGHRTVATLDADGHLAALAHPGGSRHAFTYHAAGLLATATDPNDHVTRFAYDGQGRLAREENAAGGALDLARTREIRAYEVTARTALGRTTRYRVEAREDGARRRVTTSPSGIATESITGADGSYAMQRADGTMISTLRGPDARFGMEAPVVTSMTTDTGGRRYELRASQSAVLPDPLDPLSLVTLTDTYTVNGRTATSVYTAASRTTVLTTPAGRTTTTVRDAQGRPTRVESPGLHPVELAYDGRGRLAGLTMGDRSLGFAYGTDGFLERITGSDGDWTFARDAVGRPIRQTSPGGETLQLAWDAKGNLASVTPPGRPAHGLGYTPVDRLAAFTPPAVPGVASPATTYTYNLDQQLERIDRPDGTRVDLTYDPGGRLDTMSLGRGVVDYDHDPATGKLARITAPGGETLAYTYTGGLLTGIASGGTATGSIEATYDGNFAVTRLTVNGGAPIDFAHDADLLLVRAGALTLARDPSTGLVTGHALGDLSTTLGHNGFSELTSVAAAHAGTALYQAAYERDGRGRVTRKTETVAGVTETVDYGYDAGARLTEVRRNGVLVATYGYDANGNRVTRTAGGLTETGVHDDQDRLLQYGAATFAHGAAGERRSRTQSGATTQYEYDERGNLLRVDLPGGVRIDYAIDGRDRRVGKTITGGPGRRWLYQEALRPIAELDASGHVVSRFVHASRRNVPDYMLRGGVAYLLVTDALGSVRLVVDSQTGAVAQRLDYDEFGRVLLDTNPGFQPFGFAGGLYDPDTGLVRFGRRDYDAATGRWTARDRRGLAGGDPNLYAYVRNDPASLTDPLGEPLPLLPALGVAACAGGACQAAVAAAGTALLVGTAALAAAILNEVIDNPWDEDTIPDGQTGDTTDPIAVPVPVDVVPTPDQVVPVPDSCPPAGPSPPEEPKKDPETPREEPDPRPTREEVLRRIKERNAERVRRITDRIGGNNENPIN
jgi:RHS repeat-associated protein